MEDHRRSLATEGQRPRGHFVEHGAKGEQIGTQVYFFSPRLLGRHVGNRAQCRSRTRQVRLASGHGFGFLGGCLAGGQGNVGDLGQAKVQNLGVTPLGHEDVCRLDIPVDDALSMGGVERVRHLDRHGQQDVEFQRTASDPVPQGHAVQILHGQEALAGVLADFVNRANVGMV